MGFAVAVQFYIETRNSLGDYNSKFSYLECVGAGDVWVIPYNSVRDYPGYNSKLGYNSSFFVFGIREGG